MIFGYYKSQFHFLKMVNMIFLSYSISFVRMVCDDGVNINIQG